MSRKLRTPRKGGTKETRADVKARAEVARTALPTHLVAVIDRSGSMGGRVQDVIGGFNTFLAEQKKLPGVAHLTLIQFDDKYEVNYSRRPIAECPELNAMTYQPRGSTALYDALGRAIREAATDARVLVCVVTDGEENASREVTRDNLKALVEQKTGAGWQFVYLASDPLAAAAAQSFGILRSNTVVTMDSAIGVVASMSAVSKASAKYRSGQSAFTANELNEDYAASLKGK